MHGLGVRPDAAIRRGALHRPDHRHRALHVREHGAARAPDGRRADRRPASTFPRSTAGYTRTCPQAKLALLALALAQVQRFDGGELTLAALTAAGLRPRRAPRRATRRGSSTSCARSRAPRSPCSSASSQAESARDSTKSRCGRPTTTWTCRSSRALRAAEATAARPASRPRWRPPSWSRSCAPRSMHSCTSPRRAPGCHSRLSGYSRRPTERAMDGDTAHRQARRDDLTRRGRGGQARAGGVKTGMPGRSIRSRAAC